MCWQAVGAAQPRPGTEKQGKPKFTIGKQTTFVTCPLDKDGFVDYAAALNERAGQGVTPETNVNVLLWKAFGPRYLKHKLRPEFFQCLGMPVPPEQGDYFVDLEPFFTKGSGKDRAKRLQAMIDQMDPTSERPWTARQYPETAAWLKANEQPLTLFLEASKRPHYYSPLVPDPTASGEPGLLDASLVGLHHCRTAAHTLTVRAMLRVGEGHAEEAWQDLLACHRLGRLVTGSPLFVQSLTGVGMDRLAGAADLAFLESPGLSAKAIKGCLRDLQRLRPRQAIADQMDFGERLCFLDTVMMINRHGVKYLDRFFPTVLSTPESLKEVAALKKRLAETILPTMDWDPVLEHANRWSNREVDALRQKDRATREKLLGQIKKDVTALKRELLESATRGNGAVGDNRARGKLICDLVIAMFPTTLPQMQHAFERSEQMDRILHVAFALAAYHREQGRYPPNLDALVPGYLKRVPGDLFSGKALIYRPSEKGYLLYSVGINGRDEQGRGGEDNPPGDDLSVRMPLAPLSRRP
jgi:hypothetical protein